MLALLLALSSPARAQFNNSVVGCANVPAQTGDVVTSGCAATIQAGAVTSGKLGSGAAASNMGSAGGDLTGTFPSPTVVGMSRRLCKIAAVNMNVTTDQTCTLPAAVTAWALTAVWVTNCSGTLAGGLAAGGVYTAASKGGTALVAAIQIYTGLTAAVILPLTIATGLTTRQAGAAVFFSLTMANGSAVTCDFYVLGNDLT